MLNETTYPLAFDFSQATKSEYLQDTAIRLLVDFFRDKGLESLKQEDRQEDWYQDWIDYQAQHGLYASLLSPQRYSSRGHHFDLRKLTRFVEVFAYYSPAHAYSLHVSFLGLFVILLSDNEPLKREAIARLEAGGLFAFAVSERDHGSDLLADEFAIRADGGDGLLTSGKKFYIGNANCAGMISVMARMTEDKQGEPTRRSAFVFFALRPDDAPGFQNVQKIRTLGIRSAFVGEFEVRNHPVAAGDIISEGRGAWDAVFATVNFGKFFLGFGAIGSCSHAFAEAVDHLHRRVLYGHQVTDMPHIRVATTIAFARLTAMKLFACRALDYVQVANKDERRYLLFNSVQKARVSTEGVKVMTLLSECVGAWGFESETYFEMALRDTQLIPALEGSTHINFGLTAKFIETYFAEPTDGKSKVLPLPFGVAGDENAYWMEAPGRGTRSVRFADCLIAYQPLRSIANVESLTIQVEQFREFVHARVAASGPMADAGVNVALGKCFSIIAYAQLVAEHCVAVQLPHALISVIFHGIVEDLSTEVLRLASMFPVDSDLQRRLKSVVRIPETDTCHFEEVAKLIADRYVQS